MQGSKSTDGIQVQ